MAWFASFPWWSALAAHAACVAVSAAWARARLRRLDALAPEAIDTRKELEAVGRATTVAIMTVLVTHALLPSPFPRSFYAIVEWVAACGLVSLVFIPVRKRAAMAETPVMDVAWGMLAQFAITFLFMMAFAIPMLTLGISGVDGISNHTMSLEWAVLRVIVVSCAAYGGLLAVWALLGPWMASEAAQGQVDDGILLDMAAAAFRRAGLPAPRVLLTDGRIDGEHMVAYCAAPLGLSKTVILVDEDILSAVTVRELHAALCHEAAHAARDHQAADFLWRWLLAVIPCACVWLSVVVMVRFDFDHGVPVITAVSAASLIAIFLYSMRLSRAREMDADADAVLRYGVDPEAMLDVVATLDRINGGIEKPKFWESRTHPHLDERAAELRRRVALSGG